MKRSLFTIFFMVLITVVFIALLAAVHGFTLKRIQENAEILELKSILYAFQAYPNGLDINTIPNTSTTADLPWSKTEIYKRFRQNLRSVIIPVDFHHPSYPWESMVVSPDSIQIWIFLDSLNRILSYGFPMQGKGLWGTISAFGAVTRDLKHMVGLDFTQQVETPGLGARITEHEFKRYFCSLSLDGFIQDDRKDPPVVMVMNKEKTNHQEATNTFQAITGATQTCQGVLRMINTDLGFYLRFIRENQELINKKVFDI